MMCHELSQSLGQRLFPPRVTAIYLVVFGLMGVFAFREVNSKGMALLYVFGYILMLLGFKLMLGAFLGIFVAKADDGQIPRGKMVVLMFVFLICALILLTPYLLEQMNHASPAIS